MSFLRPRYGVETQTERSEVDKKTQTRSTGATWGAEANRDTLAVNLSRCAQRLASVMADTAVGATFQLGISGLNGREFLAKGHLMIALSVL